MTQQELEIKTYKVSTDNSLLDQENKITPQVRSILEEIHPDVERGRKYLIKKLDKLCIKFPRVPVFKNLLSSVYQLNGNYEKAKAVNTWLVKEHPDYLFGKLNLAAQFLLEEEPEKVPAVLGERMEIGLLYPHRQEFHVDEVLGFNNLSVQYFLAMDELEQAEMRLKLMQDIDNEHPKTRFAEEQIEDYHFYRDSLREEERLSYKYVEVKTNRAKIQTTKTPEFHFPEQVGWLYNHDFSIDQDKIHQILQLEINKLTEDLEKMLQDSIARYDYFSEEAKENGYNNRKFDFPIHALLLLAELKNPNSLGPILEMLKQDSDYNSFWFGDFMPQIMDNVLFHCGREQTPILFDFLKLPNVYDMNKGVVGEALVKIIADSQNDKSYFVTKYRDLLNFYISNAADENYVDSDAIGFLISDITDLGYHELLPEIKQLFELDIVGFWICGTYDEVETDIREKPLKQHLDFCKKDLSEKYEELAMYEDKIDHVREMDDEFADDLDDSYDDEIYNNEFFDSAFDHDFNEPIVKPKKIGRNDPCPCESGKKYKKCCM